MDETTTQDVIQADVTAEASSAENQTDQTSQEETQDNSDKSQYVPYERFAEVNQKTKELERKLAEIEARSSETKTETPTAPIPQADLIKKQLKELGFVSREEIEQQESDRRLQENIKSLSEKYNGKDGRPKFSKEKVVEYAAKNLIGNLEVAYKQMHEADLINWHITQAMSKSKGVKSESSNGSGSTEIGTTDADLKQAAQSGDRDAMLTLIKRAL